MRSFNKWTHQNRRPFALANPKCTKCKYGIVPFTLLTLLGTFTCHSLHLNLTTWIHFWEPIIVQGDLPKLCMRPQWLLCLSGGFDTTELANHLALTHQCGKQVSEWLHFHMNILVQFGNRKTVLQPNPKNSYNRVKFALWIERLSPQWQVEQHHIINVGH